MRNRFRLFPMVIFAAFAMSASAIAGPFGIDQGDEPTNSKFADFTTVEGNKKYLAGKNPPKPHSAFEMYVVQFSDSTGACWVKAIGVDIEDDSYGISTRTQAEKIADQISKKYGNYEKTDTLLPGSIWDDADDWSMAIYKNERFLMYEWSNESGANLADHDLQQIFLATKATNSSDTYLVAEFYFTNHDTCEAEKDAKQEEAF